MNCILQPHFKTTQRGMMRKLKVTCRRSHEKFMYRHHVEMKTIDVTRTTCTSLDVLSEKHLEDLLERAWRKNCQMHGQTSQDSCC